MNLYAINASYAPGNEVQFLLAETDQEALEHGVYVAAEDACEANFSPSAEVYLLAENVRHIGTAWATDAPREWEWAHPGVEENAARPGLPRGRGRGRMTALTPEVIAWS